MFFALGCAAGGGDDDRSNVLGATLPPPQLQGVATLYPTDVERDPQAKADALQITRALPEVYGITEPPPTGSRLVAEWAPGAGVLVAWHEDFADYFIALIGALAASGPTWVITNDLAESQAVQMRLAAAQVDTASVLFFEYAHEAFWTRDFGPWSVVDAAGALHFVDPSYYPTRFRDDAVPTLLADYFGAQVFRPDLDAEGGNIMTNGAGLCVATTRLTYNNPPHFSFDIAAMTQTWLGCQRTVFLEPLHDERTGHVDLLAKFLSPDLVVVSQYNPTIDPKNARVTDDAAARLADLSLADGRPLRVVRLPTPAASDDVFRTYTNALQTDKAVFVPTYDDHDALNAQALDIYRAALPMEVAVVPVNASAVVEYGGAVHCTTMQVHHDALVAAPDPDDRPLPWRPPQDALADVAKTHIEPDATVTRSLDGPLKTAEPIGSLQVHVKLEGRTPNQVILSLSNGQITTVLHDGQDASVLDDMPTRFVTDAFVDVMDAADWTLTVTVPASRRPVGLHRWYIRPNPESSH